LIRAVVFDFDGVLADSEPLHLRVYQELLAPNGINLTRALYCERYLGLDDEGVFRQVAADYQLLLGDEEIELLIREKAQRFERLVTGSNVLYPSAAPCVRRLSAEWPVSIASGALRHEIELILRGADLLGSFRVIVSAGETERSKPAPDPYLRAAEVLATDPRSCVVIEDSRWGLTAARGAGMRTVGITTNYPREALHEADAIVDSLDEVTVEMVRSLARG
jgi:beta-phosphoglucomutase